MYLFSSTFTSSVVKTFTILEYFTIHKPEWAVPIFNINNEIVASLSASGPSNRFEEKEVVNYVAILKKGADAIRQKIGFF